MSTNPSAADTAQSVPPNAAGPRTNAMSAQLARNWGLVLARGILAFIFGLIAVLMPGPTLAALVLVFGAYMVVDGIFAIVAAVRAARRQERWALLVLDGIVDFAAAAAAFLWPGVTILAFVLIAAAWGIVSGVLMTAAAFNLRRDHGRGWLLAGGLLSVLWGILVALFPAVGAVVMTIWLGAYALVFGVSMIVLAMRLRNRSRLRPLEAEGAAGASPAWRA